MGDSILIFSDIHIHPHKKDPKWVDSCLEVLEWVFDVAEKNNISDIVFGGDLFHDRAKIDILTYHKTFDLLRKKLAPSNSPNLYLLLGNHDLWLHEKTDYSSVYPLSAIEKITVISEPCTIKVGNHEMSFLPYTHDPIRDLEKIKNNYKPKVLVGHIAIDGAIFNSSGTLSEVNLEHDGEMIKVSKDIFNDWDHVFLGHYHAEQKISKNVEYIGSPLQLSFGELGQKKHIVIFDFKTSEKIYIENNFSKVHRYLKETDNVDNIKGDYVKLFVNDVNDPKVIDLVQKLSKVVSHLSIRQNEKQVSEDLKILIMYNKC